MSKIILLLVVVGLALSGSAVCADWTATPIAADGTTTTLIVTPSWTLSDSGYAYSYEVYNPTAQYVTGFTLVFPTSVPVTGFTNLMKPQDWDVFVWGELSNKINWRPSTGAAFIAPNTSKTFGFTSQFGPSAQLNLNASAQATANAFDGPTYGPAVPEPASLLTLGMGLIGLVSARLRKK